MTEPTEDQPTPQYELVMPFVVCASQGGPHDDQAFVAGYRLGRLNRDLELAALIDAQPGPVAVPPGDMPQVDLIAMRHGYTVQAEPWKQAPDEWVTATFRQAHAETEGP